ncbi:MAG: flagellar hook assembly protein FlgD [bacterium]
MLPPVTIDPNSPAFLAKKSVFEHKLGEKPGAELIQSKDKGKELTGNDFMKLLVTQLQNQNPLDPMGSSDMLGQISALTSSRLSESLDLFSKNQNSALGQGMLGREVVIQTPGPDGKLQEVSGMVSAIKDLGKDTCKIEVDGKFYKPAEVVRISSHPEHTHYSADANILGKVVVLDSNGEKISGEVTSLSNPNADTRICVNGKWYSPDTIQTISLKEEA